jgi:hypothetical protein
MLDLARPRGEAEAGFRRAEIRTVRCVEDGTRVLHTKLLAAVGDGVLGCG